MLSLWVEILLLHLIFRQAFLHLCHRCRQHRHRFESAECFLQKVAGGMEANESELEGPIRIAPDSEGIQYLPNNQSTINSTIPTVLSSSIYL